MSVREAVTTAVILISLGFSACAPRLAIRIPTPPAKVRKEAAISRIGPPKKTPVPPPPDYGKLYAEAIDQTKKAISKGQATDALPHWKRLEESSWRADAIYHQGVLHHIAGELDHAADQYHRALSASPSFEPASANLLGIYLLRGEKPKMESLVARIFPPGADPSPEMLPELQANLGSALLETGRRDEAAPIFLALKARKPRTPSLPWNMAVMSYREGNRETAKELASNLPPEVASLYPVVASRVAWTQDSQTVPVLDKVPAGQPRLANLSQNLSAFSGYRKGDLEAAERHLLPAATDNAVPAELISNLGLLQMEMGKWKEARASLERVTTQHPSLPEGWLNLGIFLEVYEGNPQRARECYKTYVRMNGYRKKEVDAWIGWLPESSPSLPRP
jgi:Flp pilus assembly protein TadD